MCRGRCWTGSWVCSTVGAVFEREDGTERYYVAAHRPDSEAVALAVAWAARFAQRHGHARAVMFVSGLAQLDPLARSLRLAPARLRRDRAFRAGGVTFEVATERQHPRHEPGGPVVGVWVDDRQVEKYLDGLNAPALCVVPWTRDGVDQWKANWGSTELRSGVAAGEPATVGNPVVVAALESLTIGVNLSTGLSHPSDKGRAVQMFRLLRDAGEPFVPTEVQAWAVRHGWRPGDARELAQLAQAILDRRAIRGGTMLWRKDIVDYWREQARSDPGEG